MESTALAVFIDIIDRTITIDVLMNIPVFSAQEDCIGC